MPIFYNKVLEHSSTTHSQAAYSGGTTSKNDVRLNDVQSNDVHSNDVQSNDVTYSTTTENSKNLFKSMEKLPLWSSKSNVHDFLDEFERTAIDINIDSSSLFRLFLHCFKKDPATLNTAKVLLQRSYTS